ncbi:MAG: hypothetical protein RR235_06695 [Oscillospiraceae bacterium]
MKKALKAMLLLAMLLVFCSCSYAHEINERAIVKTIGIDFYRNTVCITAVYLVPTNDEEKSKDIVIAGTSNSIETAFEKLRKQIASNIYFGHCTQVILGITASKMNADTLADTLENLPEIRKNALVAVASGSAEELLNVRHESGLSVTETIDRLIRKNKDRGNIAVALSDITAQKEGFLLPVIAAKINKSKDVLFSAVDTVSDEEKKMETPSSVVMEGELLFSEDNSAYRLSGELMDSVLFLTHRSNGALLEIGEEKNGFMCEISEVGVQFAASTAKKLDGQNIMVNCKFKVSPFEQESFFTDVEILKMCEEKMEKNLSHALQFVLYNRRCDIFGINWLLKINGDAAKVEQRLRRFGYYPVNITVDSEAEMRDSGKSD